MKIDNLRDLQKLIALCHKTGVRSIKIDGIEMDLGAPPLKDTLIRSTPQAIDTSFDPGPIIPYSTTEYSRATEPKPELGELTDEQLLFYSSDSGVQ